MLYKRCHLWGGSYYCHLARGWINHIKITKTLQLFLGILIIVYADYIAPVLECTYILAFQTINTKPSNTDYFFIDDLISNQLTLDPLINVLLRLPQSSEDCENLKQIQMQSNLKVIKA